MVTNGAHIVLNVLAEQNTDTVFCYPGGAVIELFDALYDYKDTIKQIVTSHEQGASHAADGYARSTGKTGVVIATSGPGATNLVTGIAAAYMDSVPMVAITGNVSVSSIGKDSFQEVYIAGITMPITKHNFVVRSIDELAPTLRKAFSIAGSGRKGPVLVDIPRDVLKAEGEYIKKEPVIYEPKAFGDEKKLSRAAEMLSRAKKPLIYFGGGINSPDAAKYFSEFIKKTEIPCVHTIMATGIMDFEDELNLGMLGMHGSGAANSAINEADVIFACGTRFSDRVVVRPESFAKKAKIIHLDIDPSEINKNVKAHLSLEGDAASVLKALIPLVSKKDLSAWKKQIQKFKDEDFVPDKTTERLTPYNIMSLINEKAGEDAIYTTDVGKHQMWAAQYIKKVRPKSFLTSGGLGAMGYGYGAAIGAKSAFPERCVIHITSDGSFMMNLNEAATAARYSLGVISVILNNSSLGMVRQWQDVLCDGRHHGSSVSSETDYMLLAKGFGVSGYRCTTYEEFCTAFSEAIKKKTPVWIECLIDKDEKVLPMIYE